jgi:hypothetical protein
MFGGELTKVEIVQRLGFQIEAIDDPLLPLEQLGIVTVDVVGFWHLTCLPRTPFLTR